MEKLTGEKRAKGFKMSTKRLRAKLQKAGYDESEIHCVSKKDTTQSPTIISTIL